MRLQPEDPMTIDLPWLFVLFLGAIWYGYIEGRGDREAER